MKPARVEDLDDQAKLVASARDADEEAFSGLYLRHLDGVYSFMRIALNETVEAEEATQRVFLAALDSYRAFEPGERTFREWLLGIARVEAIERLRMRASNGRGRRVELPARREADSGEAERRALGFTSDEELMLLIDCLPEGQRQAIVLRHALGFSLAEIAEVLGTSEERVRQLERRGITFLRERLAALGREPEPAGRHAMRRFRARRGVLRPAHSVTLLR